MSSVYPTYHNYNDSNQNASSSMYAFLEKKRFNVNEYIVIHSAWFVSKL